MAWTRGPGDASAFGGIPLERATPADGEVYAYNATTGQFEPVPGSTVVAYTIVNVAAAHNASPGELVSCDTSLGGFGVTLPNPVGISGQMITVRKASADGNAVTVTSTGGETINGDTALTIVGQYTSIDMVSNNVNWVIV